MVMDCLPLQAVPCHAGISQIWLGWCILQEQPRHEALLSQPASGHNLLTLRKLVSRLQAPAFGVVIMNLHTANQISPSSTCDTQSVPFVQCPSPLMHSHEGKGLTKCAA